MFSLQKLWWGWGLARLDVSRRRQAQESGYLEAITSASLTFTFLCFGAIRFECANGGGALGGLGVARSSFLQRDPDQTWTEMGLTFHDEDGTVRSALTANAHALMSKSIQGGNSAFDRIRRDKRSPSHLASVRGMCLTTFSIRVYSRIK